MYVCTKKKAKAEVQPSIKIKTLRAEILLNTDGRIHLE